MSRIISEPLDQILHTTIPVLDKGAISVLEYMGTDSTITQAARISYGTGTKTTRNDAALVDYLLRNKHTSPFEMCEILLYVKLPIFIAAQWIRHRTANINSYSARYSIMQDEFYIPSAENVCGQDELNKQGSTEALESTTANKIIQDIDEHSKNSYALYEKLMQQGVSRELARTVLPQNIYTQWYWKIDLHNLMHFLALRAHSHAQYEIRAYAQAILHQVVAKWVPQTYNAFCKYRLDSSSVSSMGKHVIQDAIRGELKDRTEYVDSIGNTIGKSEWSELMEIVDVKSKISCC